MLDWFKQLNTQRSVQQIEMVDLVPTLEILIPELQQHILSYLDSIELIRAALVSKRMLQASRLALFLHESPAHTRRLQKMLAYPSLSSCTQLALMGAPLQERLQYDAMSATLKAQLLLLVRRNGLPLTRKQILYCEWMQEQYDILPKHAVFLWQCIHHEGVLDSIKISLETPYSSVWDKPHTLMAPIAAASCIKELAALLDQSQIHQSVSMLLGLEENQFTQHERVFDALVNLYPLTTPENQGAIENAMFAMVDKTHSSINIYPYLFRWFVLYQPQQFNDWFKQFLHKILSEKNTINKQVWLHSLCTLKTLYERIPSDLALGIITMSLNHFDDQWFGRHCSDMLVTLHPHFHETEKSTLINRVKNILKAAQGGVFAAPQQEFHAITSLYFLANVYPHLNSHEQQEAYLLFMMNYSWKQSHLVCALLEALRKIFPLLTSQQREENFDRVLNYCAPPGPTHFFKREIGYRYIYSALPLFAPYLEQMYSGKREWIFSILQYNRPDSLGCSLHTFCLLLMHGDIRLRAHCLKSLNLLIPYLSLSDIEPLFDRHIQGMLSKGWSEPKELVNKTLVLLVPRLSPDRQATITSLFIHKFHHSKPNHYNDYVLALAQIVPSLSAMNQLLAFSALFQYAKDNRLCSMLIEKILSACQSVYLQLDQQQQHELLEWIFRQAVLDETQQTLVNVAKLLRELFPHLSEPLQAQVAKYFFKMTHYVYDEVRLTAYDHISALWDHFPDHVIPKYSQPMLFSMPRLKGVQLQTPTVKQLAFGRKAFL